MAFRASFLERLRRARHMINRTCWSCNIELDGQPPSNLCDDCWSVLRSGKDPRKNSRIK